MSFISRLLKSDRPVQQQQQQQRQHTGEAGPAASSKSQQQRRQGVEPATQLRIVVRGDSSVGKTCLLARLQGRPYLEDYSPTARPQVATVRWNCGGRAATLMVWDAVDAAGRPRRARSGLKLANECEDRRQGNGNGRQEPSDLNGGAEAASDVYAGCHGAILMFDMTKAWTLTYVERELGRAPRDLPLLVLANHRDMGHHRCITADQARMVIRDSGRPTELTRYAESSMRNGYGLAYVHRFLCLPYLCAQRQRLLQRLQANAEDAATAVLELQLEEDESSQGSDGIEPATKDSGETTTVRLDSAKPPEPAPPCRLKAPPARLIPGAEQYLMELRRAQPQRPEAAYSAPAPAPSPSPPTNRPEPTGAPAIEPGTDADADADAEVNEAAANSDKDVDSEAEAEVSTRVDDVDAEESEPATTPIAETPEVSPQPPEEEQKEQDEEEVDAKADEEQAEQEAVPPAPAVNIPDVDWGPLLAKYEDPPKPQSPAPEASKAGKKKKKQQELRELRAAAAAEAETATTEQVDDQATAASGKKNKKKKQQQKKKKAKAKAAKTEAEPEQPARLKAQKELKLSNATEAAASSPKAATMTKEEEELERFLNE